MAKAGTGKEAVRKTWRGSEEEKGEFLMKKHNMMRAASALAVVTLLSTGLISGTLAKYTSSGSGSDTAVVAKWAIKAGTGNSEGNLDVISGYNKGKSNAMTFDLFKTNRVFHIGSIASDDNVKNAASVSDNAIVAPGTWGYVDLKIENTSDVAANYTITFEKLDENTTDGKTLPLDYAVKSIDEDAGAEYPTDEVKWTQTMNELTVTADGDTSKKHPNVLGVGDSKTTATYRVYWKWDYDTTQNPGANDARDTDLGVGTTATQTITAKVTATQVD